MASRIYGFSTDLSTGSCTVIVDNPGVVQDPCLAIGVHYFPMVAIGQAKAWEAILPPSRTACRSLHARFLNLAWGGQTGFVG